MDIKECKFVCFVSERGMKKLYKGYLRQIEDLYEEGYIDQAKFDFLRNRILDLGNESIREFDDALQQYMELRN